MPVALDSNILLYAAQLKRVPDDEIKVARAKELLNRLATRTSLVLPFQVLGETYRVLTGKGRHSRPEARKIIEQWRAVAVWTPSSSVAFENGFELAARHGFQIWDALIVAVSAEAGCEMLISEDMQNGFVWRDLTIVDPFKTEPHPRLAALLAG